MNDLKHLQLYVWLALLCLSSSLQAQDWYETQKFTATDLLNNSASGHRFGESIDIDGNFAVIGASGGDLFSGGYNGAAYVFELIDRQWVQRAKLTSTDGQARDRFGYDVAIEGDVIVVSAPLYNGQDTQTGKVYIFEKPGGGWVDATETVAFTDPNQQLNGRFGFSFELSGDDLMIAAPYADGFTTESGKVMLFAKASGASWTTASHVATFTHPTGVHDTFGIGLALTPDYLVSGALTGSNAGSGHIFEKGTGWVSKADDDVSIARNPRLNNDHFGGNIAAEGDFVAVTSRVPATMQVWVFKKPASGWANTGTQRQSYGFVPNLAYYNLEQYFQQATFTDLEIEQGRLFFGLARSSTIDNQTREGVVFEYELGPASGTEKHKFTASDLTANMEFGASVAAEGNHLLIAATNHEGNGVVYYFKREYRSSSSAHLCFGESLSLGSQTISAAGTYSETFSAQDGLDSLVELTVTKNEPLNFAITRQEIDCKGGTGSMTFDAPTGGNGGPYQYAINNGSFQSSPAFNNLAAGTYQLTITDGLCERTFPTTLSEPEALTLISITEESAVSCTASDDGSATVSLDGGSAGYSYSLDGTTFTYAGAKTATGLTFSVEGLASGSNTIFFKDDNGCKISGSVTIGSPDALSLTASVTDNACSATSSGSISLTAGGGTSPYSYSLDGTNYQASPLFEGLAAGEYTPVVKDANGCTLSQSFTVSNTVNITASIAGQNLTCHGADDGKITLSAVAGGAEPYQYSLDGTYFQAEASFSSLAAGEYTVTVQDANGCHTTLTQTISSPASLSTSATTVAQSCASNAEGSISIRAEGGTQPYQYSLDGTNFQAENIFAGLAADDYTFTVTDANGCSFSQNITLGSVAALVLTETIQPSTAYPENGSISVSVSGGTPPYSYAWNHGPESAEISGLVPDNYSLTVTDAKGCQVSATYTVGGVTSIGDDLPVSNIKLYPNPVNGNFSLELPHDNSSRSAALYSLLGKKIRGFALAPGKNQFNKGSITSGIYLLKFDDGTHLKIVIE